MNRNIEQIMELFRSDPFWELDELKTPDKAQLEKFTALYNLPEDYVKLLSITDGFVLFHAGDYAIHDMAFVSECRQLNIDTGLLEQVLEIGYFTDYTLLINRKESQTSTYLYAGNSCSMKEYVRIGTITDFLNGLIASKGEIPCWKDCETEGLQNWDGELFDFSQDNLYLNQGILEVPARGYTIVSRQPYEPTEEEIRVNGNGKAVLLTYSNGIQEKWFLRDEETSNVDMDEASE